MHTFCISFDSNKSLTDESQYCNFYIIMGYAVINLYTHVKAPTYATLQLSSFDAILFFKNSISSISLIIEII